MSKHRVRKLANLTINRGKILASFLLAFVIAIMIWIYWNLQPVAGQAMRTIHIASGSSSKQIAQILYQNDMVRSQLGFRIYLLTSGYEGKLKAGDYQFKQGQTLRQIIELMASGDRTTGTVRFTIPEGYSIEKSANLLQKDGIVSAQTFLQAADHGTYQEPLVQDIPKDPAIRHRLEGYLFPDTYDIYTGTSANEIIDKMLERTQQVMDKQIIDDSKKRGLTVHQILTIASMVEREAKVDQERPVIAGVIYNRLKQKPPMLLQIDATIEYILGNKFPLSDQDLAVKNPYNTYLNQGLPPGPIASPGIKSILAAVYPEHNEYLFYVVKNNGSGEHYFSKTFAEQLQNEAKSEHNATHSSSSSQ